MTREPDDEERKINITKSKGSRDIIASEMPTDKVQQPLKIHQVNIGMTEYPKFANVGYYWDKATMANITDLLHEFQD